MDTKHKQRDREDEIKIAAIAYSNENCKEWLRDKETGHWYKRNEEELDAAFIAGATFADKCPREGLVDVEYVRAIYNMWLEDGKSDFLEYFTNYCRKEGWL